MTDSIRRAGQVAWAAVGIATLLALLGLVAWTLRVVFPPLIFAGAIVFLLNPIVVRLHRHGVPRALGALATYVAILGAAVLLVFAFRPVVSHQVDELRDEWPEVRDKVDRWIDDRAVDSQGTFWEFTRADLDDAFAGDRPLSDQLDRARDIGLRVFHVLLVVVLGPILAFYLLVDLPRVREVALSLVPERAKPEVVHVSRRLNAAIGGFFRGQLLVAFIVGIMCSVGLAIIGLPFWLFIGMIAGVFNIVPLVGPWIGGIPGVVVALTTREPITALWVVAVMAGAQQIDNHLVTPYVMHRTVKLHPVVVVLALLAGGTLGGFAGLLLAVPATAVLKILLGHLWRVHVLGEPFDVVAAAADAEDTAPGVGYVEDVVSVLPERSALPESGERAR